MSQRVASDGGQDLRDFRATWWEPHHRAVWHHLRRRGVPRADRDDVVQEVFLALFRKLGDYAPSPEDDPMHAQRKWILAFVNNTALNHARKQRRMPIPVEDPPEHADRAADPGDADRADRAADPEAAASASEEERIILGMLSRLPETKRLAVILHLYDGLSHREAAEILGVNANGLRRLYREAIRDLERMMMMMKTMKRRQS